MKTIKTSRQSILFKVIEKQGSFLFSAAVLHFFPFHRETLLPETDLWRFVPNQLGTESAIDMGFPKDRGEVLLAGKAFAPSGKPVRALEVRFDLGPIVKRLYVFGNRYWRRDISGMRITEPEKFEKMDIDYAHAFGGEGFDRNPRGKGAVCLITAEGREVRPLPNIEHPDHLVFSPEDRPDPSGFGPLDITWPQRQSKAGTYDDHWFQTRFPGLADDMDPTFFNEAPPDQWIKGYFRGDEKFGCYHMHPEKPFVQGRLPGFRARSFINQRTNDGETLLEIKMNPETVWLFPHEEKGILIHRGVAPIRTDDAEDVLHLMTAYESIHEEPTPFEHYRREFENRIDEETGYLYALYEPGLVPASEIEDQASDRDLEQNAYEKEGLLTQHQMNRVEKEKKRAEEEKEKALAKARAQLESHGLDPSVFMPPPGVVENVPESPVIDPDNLDPKAIIEFIKKAEEDSRNQEEKARAEAAGFEKQAEKQIKELSLRFGLDFEKLLAEARSSAPKRPVFSADETIVHLKQTRDMMEKQVRNFGARLGLDPDELMTRAKAESDETNAPLIRLLDDMRKIDPEDPELIARLRQAEEMSREGYRQSTHRSTKLEKPSPEEASRMREDFKDLLVEGKSPAGMDWAGIDLSKMDLKGIDLTEVYLEGANFSGADLSDADLTNSILARADLSGAVLHRARLHKTCLGGANLAKTELLEANLTEAILAEADLTGANLSGSDLTDTDLAEAVFSGTDLSGTTLANGLFMDVDFSGINFSGANLSETIFINPKLDGADFTGAEARSAVFISPSCMGTIFKHANLRNACFLDHARMAGANFNGAVLDQANLMEADLEGASLVETHLNEANLMGAGMKGADLRASVGKKVNLMKVDLEGAKLVGANLMEANLKSARLVKTDLKLANLYGAEVMRAILGRTELRGTNLKMTKIADWRPDDPGRTHS